MRNLLIIVLCLTSLLLYGCGLAYIYIAGYKAYRTTCTVDDSETNRHEVMQAVGLIADRYGFQDRTEEYKSRDEQRGSTSLKALGYTIIAEYYVPETDEPTNEITLSVSSHQGKLKTSLLQVKQGKATPKYIEIQDRLVSEFKERFREEVIVDIWKRRL